MAIRSNSSAIDTRPATRLTEHRGLATVARRGVHGLLTTVTIVVGFAVAGLLGPVLSPTLALATVPPGDNEFYPQDQSIGNCVGLLERPGCGSSARGGPAQTLLFVALMAGLAFIGWRIVRAMRANGASAPTQVAGGAAADDLPGD